MLTMLRPVARPVPLLLVLALVLIATTFAAGEASAAACGSAGQRACCLLEPPTNGGCFPGVVEVPHANAGLCSGFNPLGIQASSICVAATPCGGVNQRACCVGEGATCQPGLVEQPQANSGYCTNSSLGIQSSGICRAVAPCGGEGQRACCLGEAGFGACRAGLQEVPQANSGQCGNFAWGIQSSGVCEVVTPCGGEGQRACCLGEAGFGACQAGLAEVPQPNSGQCGNSLPGIQSSGVCQVVTSCGGAGERACCLGEAGFGACEAGLVEVPQANSGQCGNLPPGIQSSGVCEVVTACGGVDQRACCLLEAPFGACQPGLNEHAAPNSGQCGNLPLGIQSSGVCKPAQTLGQACGPVYQCEPGLFCDPFAGFRCVDAAGVDEACGPGVPCSNGLQCTLSLRCSNAPAQLGQTCDVGTPCGAGLYCQAGFPNRCRELRKPGEGCSAFNPCIAGASCDPCLIEGCAAPLTCNLNANQGAISEAVCRSLYSADLQAAARDTGLTMTYAIGNEIAGLVGESQSFGVAYGQTGEYGCFTTLCGGLNADVSIETFVSIGFYEDFDAVDGSDFMNAQEIQIVSVLNFATAQVFPRDGVLPLPNLIGTEDSFALGVGPDILPFSASSYLCESVLDTVVVDPPAAALPATPSRPAAAVANAGAAFDLEGWSCSDPALCTWTADDAMGRLASGSAQVESPTALSGETVGRLGSPCTSVLPGELYAVLAQAKTSGTLPGALRLHWHGGLACDGAIARTDDVASSPPDDVWRGFEAWGVAPMNAQSLSVEITAERDGASGLGSTSRLDGLIVPEPDGPTMTMLGTLAMAWIAGRRRREEGR
ncbi:MAG: hypothetical protein R3F35_08590 [Myxococcota bacterium]